MGILRIGNVTMAANKRVCKKNDGMISSFSTFSAFQKGVPVEQKFNGVCFSYYPGGKPV